MSAEADELGAIAISNRRFDSSRVQTAVRSIKDQSTVNPEVRNSSVYHPCDSVGHLKNIHKHYCLHAGIPRLHSSLKWV